MKPHLRQFRFLCCFLCLTNLVVSAQPVSDKDSARSALTISGYTDWYYGWQRNASPGFLYSFNRNKDLNTNLSFLKANIGYERFRANLAIAGGTYVRANYAAEKGIFRHIFEGNIGVRLSKQKDLWLDMGIMPSHIGFESAIGSDNWNLTRSILAENSPYFENGIKLSYRSVNKKFFVSGMILQGWQRIQRLPGNTKPSFGMQFQYQPSDQVILNYSNFLGSDSPDSAYRFRHFHNVYGIFQLSSKLGIITGIDFGAERNETWYSLASILKYALTDKWAFACRTELYHDKHQIIVKTPSFIEFNERSASLNVDFKATQNILFRIEGRWFRSTDMYTMSTAIRF